MARTNQIEIRTTDVAGNVSVQTGSVQQFERPVISSVTFSPSSLPAAGGIVRVAVVASHPDGLSFVIEAVNPSVGSVARVSANEFDWAIPAL
jgi:hypothetical protein